MNRAQNTRMVGELSGALPKSWRKSVLAKLLWALGHYHGSRHIYKKLTARALTVFLHLGQWKLTSGVS